MKVRSFNCIILLKLLANEELRVVSSIARSVTYQTNGLGVYNFTANIRGGSPVSFDIILVDARILTSEVKLGFSPR